MSIVLAVGAAGFSAARARWAASAALAAARAIEATSLLLAAAAAALAVELEAAAAAAALAVVFVCFALVCLPFCCFLNEKAIDPMPLVFFFFFEFLDDFDVTTMVDAGSFASDAAAVAPPACNCVAAAFA